MQRNYTQLFKFATYTGKREIAPAQVLLLASLIYNERVGRLGARTLLLPGHRMSRILWVAGFWDFDTTGRSR